MSAEYICRKKIVVKGIVQGVGFRPFVYSIAQQQLLSGFVFNNGNGVVIELEGKAKSIDSFYKKLHKKKPPLCRIDSIELSNLPIQNSVIFEIRKSKKSQVFTMISADISMCIDCKKEMFDKNNRRYLYPFINCTHCGPRYSIVKSLPYDRKNTTMQKFEMCSQCKEEYIDPTNRRYHAQPISCYRCGPSLEIKNLSQECIADEEKLIHTLCKCIEEGRTVALKGLGGFHLICDATNDIAVLELRTNKHRQTKPFAVMFPTIQSIKKVCKLTQYEEQLICSKERPVVIVKKNPLNKYLAKSIAPNIDKLGVFLPYTPLHELLLKKLKNPIVATSANLSDEPIITEHKELFSKMPLVVQIALTHDREIMNACDDSVMTSINGRKIIFRLARGFTPLSFVSKIKNARKILAIGANQKNTITLSFNGNIIISPHIGDLNSLQSMEYFISTVKTFKRFYNFEPDIIVCDMHPRYETTKWAKQYVMENSDVELIEVQHHYAHALATMAEYSLEEEILAFCFDGTGYGDDGNLWGGEVLLASPKKYTRVLHLQEFALLGGEKAIKEPRRVALSLLFECFNFDELKAMKNVVINSFSKKELTTFHIMRTKKINSPFSSSIGRIFDAVYALIGYIEPITYEGESGMILEALANKYPCDEYYTLKLINGVIEYKEFIKELIKEKSKKYIASKFINTLAQMILIIAQKYPYKKVVLSGGVFQNTLLLKKTIILFNKYNIEYYIQEKTPINDGGISLGQAYFALHKEK